MTSVQKMQLEIIQEILEVQDMNVLEDLQAILDEYTSEETEKKNDSVFASFAPLRSLRENATP